ncbi:MAG: hypothetical protein IPL10_02090 [Bacteroidetes bacterium]|nr:hypothetical protein [Bacteroidota bacterium]
MMAFTSVSAQKPAIYKINDLLNRINYNKVKVLLVSMDFVEELDKKLNDFLVKNKYTAEIVLLDEVNGNDFINKISEKWSGAIPATFITAKDKARNYFHEGKMTFDSLNAEILEK